MRLLRQIIEPKRLLVVWQTLQKSAEGTFPKGSRYIIGELVNASDDKIMFRYLLESPDFIKACELGFEGYSIFDKNQQVHNNTNVMSILERRLLDRQRTDFDDFLRYHRIEPTSGQMMSDFALLGYTNGKVPGDSFSFVHTFEEASIPCELIIEVAGISHYKDLLPPLEKLENKPVIFIAEPENRYDPQAVAIKTEAGELMGYVNRAQTGVFNKWLRNNNKIEGFVERVNGTIERPNILIYVKVS